MGGWMGDLLVLYTLISDVPEVMGKAVAERLCGRLLAGVQQVPIHSPTHPPTHPPR